MSPEEPLAPPAPEPPAPEPPAPGPPAQNTKADLEVKKLELEIAQLRSQLTGIGGFSRVAWPIISTLLSIAVSFLTVSILYFNYRTQQLQADLKREEVLFTALHDAADSTKAADIRISGLWALSKFWEPEYETMVANTLGAVLVTDGPEPAQRIRMNAAEVVGTAISGIPGSPLDWSRADRERAQRLAEVLYGNARTGAGGVISRVHGDVLTRLQSRDGDIEALSQQLEATKEAIRKNWKWLKNSYLHGHDLSATKLYEADLTGADLGEAVLRKTNLCKANLYEADLYKIQDWGKADLRLANIKGVRRAPTSPFDFRKFALDHGAVEREPTEWNRMVAKRSDVDCLTPSP